MGTLQAKGDTLNTLCPACTPSVTTLCATSIMTVSRAEKHGRATVVPSRVGPINVCGHSPIVNLSRRCGDANNHSQHRTTAEVPVRESGERRKSESRDDGDDGDKSPRQTKETETDIEIGNVHELARAPPVSDPDSAHLAPSGWTCITRIRFWGYMPAPPHPQNRRRQRGCMGLARAALSSGCCRKWRLSRLARLNGRLQTPRHKPPNSRDVERAQAAQRSTCWGTSLPGAPASGTLMGAFHSGEQFNPREQFTPGSNSHSWEQVTPGPVHSRENDSRDTPGRMTPGALLGA
ncbi:hypothetical protein BC826DRAFT_1180728 [Russula brevipes]|nr:hypothetical protein BC826DRAFT_1180728 [Russula brevipes]